MRFRILSSLLLLAVCFDAAAGDLYDEINRLRTREGNCVVAGDLSPLRPQAALERAARDLARGGKLEESLKAAGYRATRANTFSIMGDGIGARAAEILARQSYCRQLQEAGMSEVGVYLDARQLWIVMAAPFSPLVGVSEETAERRVLYLVNQARATPRYCGNRMFNAAQPVRWNDVLARAALLHSEDMARYSYFSHSGHDGSSPAQRVERAGYRYRSTAENIAGGQASPEDAMAGWLKSPGHCASLMNPAFTEMGAGVAIDHGSAMGVYWTQEFGAPR